MNNPFLERIKSECEECQKILAEFQDSEDAPIMIRCKEGHVIYFDEV